MIRYDINRGVSKIKTKTSLTISAIVLGVAGLGMAVAIPVASHAANNVIYNNIPQPLPSNYSSEGPEAYAFAEMAGQIQFAGTNRTDPTVTVGMSSWACQNGNWFTGGTCSTTTNDTFSWPVTVKVYNVGPGNSVGSLITSKTQTFAMPYRPSSNCPSNNTAWLNPSDGQCYHGKAFTIAFNLNGVTLPDKAIVGISYNTSHYGPVPVGNTACNSTTAGCFYDSLNIGLVGSPTVGTQPVADSAYFNYSSANSFCGHTGTTGSLQLDSGCWSGFQPAFNVTVSEPMGDQCKNNGWSTLLDANNKHFKNQGDCVSYFATNGRNVAAGAQAHVATGNVTFNSPAQTLSFNTQDNGASASDVGTVTYHNNDPSALGLTYTVPTTCVNISGNTAYFAYQIPSSAPVAANTWVVWKVVDSSTDTAGFSIASDAANADALCNSGFTPNAYGPVVPATGNIVVQ